MIMTITLAILPQTTLKTDIRFVLQRFCEVKHIFVHPGGRRADVYGVKHAYAEQFLRGGWDIIVFWKRTNRVMESGAKGSDTGMDTTRVCSLPSPLPRAVRFLRELLIGPGSKYIF